MSGSFIDWVGMLTAAVMIATGILTILLKMSVDREALRDADDAIIRRPWAFLPRRYYNAFGQRIFVLRTTGIVVLGVLLLILIAIAEARKL